MINSRITFLRRRKRIRYKIKKIIESNQYKFRLSVFRSSKQIYAQIIDDINSKTIVSASSLEKINRHFFQKGSNILAAAKVGELIAKKAIKIGITTVIFDRGGYSYHGRIKALANAARQEGLKF